MIVKCVLDTNEWWTHGTLDGYTYASTGVATQCLALHRVTAHGSQSAPMSFWASNMNVQLHERSTFSPNCHSPTCIMYDRMILPQNVFRKAFLPGWKSGSAGIVSFPYWIGAAFRIPATRWPAESWLQGMYWYNHFTDRLQSASAAEMQMNICGYDIFWKFYANLSQKCTHLCFKDFLGFPY